MKTPKEIHISTKGVEKHEVEILEELLDEEELLHHRVDENKIVVFYIKNLHIAMWLMYYLESQSWKWQEYYEKQKGGEK